MINWILTVNSQNPVKKLMEPPPFLKSENRFHPRRTNGNAIKKRSW